MKRTTLEHQEQSDQPPAAIGDQRQGNKVGFKGRIKLKVGRTNPSLYQRLVDFIKTWRWK